ncbi:hypothetical protein J6590_029479 [Homalodisca vitripennis]|nr:hypothetical protein J6590_029479 [Homalodisca vitripennis]
MDAIEELVCQVLHVFENRLFAQATLCDLSKAFDTSKCQLATYALMQHGAGSYRPGRLRTVAHEHLPSQTGVQFVQNLQNSVKSVPMLKKLV